ncbi:MAG: PGPGW domain-containing protein [Acidimicrobiia bacterium]|nr:PGPGW domain-containing protein [Acidimicrobiia bacterium]
MLKLLRRLLVSIIGLAVIVVGIALLFLPGPGTLVIIAGLAVLGSEFDRPKAWVHSMRERASRALHR